MRHCTERGRTEIKNSVGMILKVLIAFLWFLTGIIIIIADHGMISTSIPPDLLDSIRGRSKIQRAC